MKLVRVITLVLCACVYPNIGYTKTESVAQKMLKPLIEKQCVDELQTSKVWQASSLLWSKAQQTKAQNRVCTCVGENALNDVSSKEVLMASVNEDVKNKLIRQAVLNSLKGCAQEAF